MNTAGQEGVMRGRGRMVPKRERTPARKRWSFQRMVLLVVLTLMVTLVCAPSAFAQDSGVSAISNFATTAISWIRALWVVVVLAELIAFVVFVIAFFLQGVAPMLYRPFQGDWAKYALALGVLAHPIMGALLAAAEAAKGGYQ
ncbi:MAG TPA: hypothetical protein VFS21_37625 [Roseiflexaceae bacterium]|nr:hypothetical protein [Roseiflexaceae bacterium]